MSQNSTEVQYKVLFKDILYNMEYTKTFLAASISELEIYLKKHYPNSQIISIDESPTPTVGLYE